ncbi:MAG: Stk1 family PASTA domain-containing Ser/Thr kinase [Actinomycetota bacterium]
MRLLRDRVGETLSDRYRIVARIAGGGMGEVYRGHDLLLDRKVAVKVLMPSLASDPDLVQRFKAEARAAAKLNHPNVVGVHDWGSDDDRTYFMVMEYVAGTDLRDIIVGRGPMDPPDACDVVADVCEALQAAHAVGLVHRDVKPENVLIARDGTVKVADFGIAALADSDRTIPGAGILGTLRYIAPEQARGGNATAASDIWSAGALLYELLTGAPPHGGSGAELLRRRAEEPIAPPSALEPAVPAQLDDIVLRACAIYPAERFLDAGAMAAALRDARSVWGQRSRQSIGEFFRDLTHEVRHDDMVPTNHVPRMARRRERRARTRRVGIAALVAVALLFGGWKATAAIFGPKEVDVPNLVGLSEDAAAERAEEAGFEIAIVDEKRHETLEEGRIISQSPPDGLLLEGKTIRLVISLGPPLVKVPSLAGTPEQEAIEKLESLGLVVGETTEEHSVDFEAGTVISVVTSGKRLEQGSTVDLVVSKGPQNLAVPQVVEMTAAEAKKELTEAGFKVEFIDVYSDDIEEGLVVSTDPAGGLQAPEGSTVTVSVSIGPEFEMITMPDVRNMHVDDARKKLEGMGLKVIVEQSCPGSTVVDTNPLPGTKIRENGTVALFVC